ncbi:O-methyltransferase [Agromyces sp. ZXT2-3]|uniref:O-methyltransferase n=1 Tax=Agromyces sp. ZXT2-3 TaxID=3461152 RepID=UPI004054B790
MGLAFAFPGPLTREPHATRLPELLELLARTAGARRALEIGTLGGSSTIHLARGIRPDGRLVTLELEQQHADVRSARRDGTGSRSASCGSAAGGGAEPSVVRVRRTSRVTGAVARASRVSSCIRARRAGARPGERDRNPARRRRAR